MMLISFAVRAGMPQTTEASEYDQSVLSMTRCSRICHLRLDCRNNTHFPFAAAVALHPFEAAVDLFLGFSEASHRVYFGDQGPTTIHGLRRLGSNFCPLFFKALGT